MFFFALRYDPGITSVMPVASGYLTKKRRKRCLAVFTRCLAVFVDFFHFLLLLVTFLLVVSFVSYFLLVKGVSFVTFCYFFIGCNFDKLLFTVKKGQGEGFYSLCEGGT